jgi:DNA-binding CsgD family transcriptional regulator
MNRPLIGRTDELASILALVDDVAGRGATLVLQGEPGVGKSSLLGAAAEAADAAGHTVLHATGVESESALPYAGLHYLLTPLLSRVGSLPAVQRRALLTALGLELAGPAEMFLVALAALTLLTESAAAVPVVAIIDDAQWLDAPTKDVLAFLARRIQDDAVLLLVAVRRGHVLALASATSSVLEIRGLDDTSSRTVVETTGVDLTATERENILEQARGNPLALVELPAAWRSASGSVVGGTPTVLPLSARLERAFAARITELPPLTRDALLIAAVETEGELADILAGAALLSGQPVSAVVLESAEQREILEFDEVHVRFRHPLVRSGILQHESVSRRQAAHAAMGEVLSRQPYRRAWHRAQAVHGPDDGVADELEHGSEVSIRRGSVEAAISALERSAQLTTSSPRRGRRLLLAAHHAFGLGRADLVNHFIRAAGNNELSEFDLARMELMREIFNDGVPGDGDRVLSLCAMATRADTAGDVGLALDLLLGAAIRCWWAETGPQARARVVAVAEQLSAVQDDPRCVAAIALAEPIRKGRQTAAHLASIGVETLTDADDLRLLGTAARAVGAETRAADFFQRAESMLREQGRLGHLSHVLAMQAAVHVDLGDWRRAAETLDEARRLAVDTGQPVWTVGVVVIEARTAALSGDKDRALHLATEVELASSNGVNNDLLANAQLARGFAWLAVGRHSEAYAALKPLFEPLDPRHHQREQFSGVMFLAESAMHCGKRDEAAAVIARMEHLATVTPSPVLATQLLYARAVLAHDTDAEALYLAGLAEDLTRWPWVRARLQLAYGSWLRRQRRVSESREPLRLAEATFQLIGAVPWAAQAGAELRAAGERGAEAGWSSATALLSAQELHIARLAARGLTNREIGQQLYLSPRTVGSHLYRIFPKLGVTSRAQLSIRLSVD